MAGNRDFDLYSLPDEYKALHPMGIAPVITDGDLVLGESGAICDYICARYGDGRLTPKPNDPDFADHLFWFHWSNGTFMTTLMMQLVLAGGGEGNPASVFVNDRSQRGWATSTIFRPIPTVQSSWKAPWLRNEPR